MVNEPILTGPINELKQCRYGAMLYNRHDIYVGGSFKHYGEFSEGEVAVFRQLVRPGQTVLDVGANIGAHTVPLAQMVGAEGSVHAFEPQRPVFQTLCANAALNSLTNIRCYPNAVGDSDGLITVPPLDYGKQENFGGLSLEKKGEGEQVRVLRLDDLGLEQCHFIKIDVEGMELGVLAGAAETLQSHRPLLYVENDRQAKSSELITFLLDRGYRLFWHLTPLFSADNFFGNATNIFGRIVSANMLCVHEQVSIRVEGLRQIIDPADWPFNH